LEDDEVEGGGGMGGGGATCEELDPVITRELDMLVAVPSRIVFGKR